MYILILPTFINTIGVNVFTKIMQPLVLTTAQNTFYLFNSYVLEICYKRKKLNAYSKENDLILDLLSIGCFTHTGVHFPVSIVLS